MLKQKYNVAEALELWGKYHTENSDEWNLQYDIAETFSDENEWVLQIKKLGLLRALKDGVCVAHGYLSPVNDKSKSVSIPAGRWNNFLILDFENSIAREPSNHSERLTYSQITFSYGDFETKPVGRPSMANLTLNAFEKIRPQLLEFDKYPSKAKAAKIVKQELDKTSDIPTIDTRAIENHISAPYEKLKEEYEKIRTKK